MDLNYIKCLDSKITRNVSQQLHLLIPSSTGFWHYSMVADVNIYHWQHLIMSLSEQPHPSPSTSQDFSKPDTGLVPDLLSIAAIVYGT